jgi:hypothetical protein
LINIENLFINNKNILSKASYVNSNIALGDDLWYDGLWNNSIWNSGTFSKGLVKESSWHNGRFVTGKFYQSKSFNAIPDSVFQYYDVDRIYSSWKKGNTSDILANDRYSWRKGTFVNGEFVKSDWESGDFLNGKFYNSKWYSGTFSKGIIGDNTLSFSDTKFYNGQIKTSIVENAKLYAEDTSFLGASTSTILWETGTFNAGVFGCDILNQPASITLLLGMMVSLMEVSSKLMVNGKLVYLMVVNSFQDLVGLMLQQLRLIMDWKMVNLTVVNLEMLM